MEHRRRTLGGVKAACSSAARLVGESMPVVAISLSTLERFSSSSARFSFLMDVLTFRAEGSAGLPSGVKRVDPRSVRGVSTMADGDMSSEADGPVDTAAAARAGERHSVSPLKPVLREVCACAAQRSGKQGGPLVRWEA